MVIEWEKTSRGLVGDAGRFTVWVRPTKSDDWTWQLEAPDRDHDVRGRAATEQAAKDYVTACLHVAIERDAAMSVRRKNAQIDRLVACITGAFPSLHHPGWEAWRKEATEAILDAKGGGR